MKRVVITGFGAFSPIGSDWETASDHLRHGRSGVRRIDAWDSYAGLQTRLGAPALGFELPPHFTRKRIRGMGRVALLAVRATELALADAGLLDSPELQDGSIGAAYGSSSGGTEASVDLMSLRADRTTRRLTATTYIESMAHTSVVNIAIYFGLRGRIITTSSACTSGSQGIGYAYETIKYGHQVAMVAGGTEELAVTVVGVFDVLFATSRRNDAPQSTPRPFDAARDGLVVAEGACTLVLEELEHARARGATIHAEVVGFGTNCDGTHLTNPAPDTMRGAMLRALDDAGLAPEAIGYVCAHATATERGDIAESHATHAVFGPRIPISSLKGCMGHTMGATGALESWLSIEMMRHGWFAPTLHLEDLDPRCADLDYITGRGRALDLEYVMNNNFAFGGINTSLIFRRV